MRAEHREACQQIVADANSLLANYEKEQAEEARDVDAAISACGGNPRAALRAMIITVSFLSAELKAARQAASKGYARRKTRKAS